MTVFGVSYRTANVHQRQAYSLSEVEQAALLSELVEQTDFRGFIVSTCNRTEIIGTTQHPDAVKALYLDHTQGTTEEFADLGYSLFGMEALEHLFRVGVGMESQIPGDFEIIMQIRKGFRWAYKANAVDGYLEKIVNHVIHASKRVKTETGFSTGATSVSYAAARFLKDSFEDIAERKITLYGLGKFGRITLDHLLGLTSPSNITLVNRSDEKAEHYANETGATYVPHARLQDVIDHSGILIVATGADRPILTVNELDRPQLHTVIDMAVPSNVDPEVGNLPQLRLLDVDQLSQMTRDALQKRVEEVPVVEAIITEELNDLLDWHTMRGHAPQIETAINSILELGTNLVELVAEAYETTITPDSQDFYLRQKMQRYFCHHIRRGASVEFIRTDLSSKISVTSSK